MIRLKVIVIQQAGRDYPEHLKGIGAFHIAQSAVVRSRLELRPEDKVQMVEDTSDDGIWTVIDSDDIKELLGWVIEYHAIGSLCDIAELDDEVKDKVRRLCEAIGINEQELADMFGLLTNEEMRR